MKRISSQLTLFTFRGIRIGVDYSWFFVLFLVILSLSGFYENVLGAEQEDVGLVGRQAGAQGAHPLG